VILIDDEEEELNSQTLLKLSPLYKDRFDDITIVDFMDDTFWLDNIDRIEGSITDPTAVSAFITDIRSDAFKDLLDPALFRSESAIF